MYTTSGIITLKISGWYKLLKYIVESILVILDHSFIFRVIIPDAVLTLRRLMSYIYMEHPFLMFLDHTRRSTVGRTPLDE